MKNCAQADQASSSFIFFMHSTSCYMCDVSDLNRTMCIVLVEDGTHTHSQRLCRCKRKKKEKEKRKTYSSNLDNAIRFAFDLSSLSFSHLIIREIFLIEKRRTIYI